MQGYFYRWRGDGTWHCLNRGLVRLARKGPGVRRHRRLASSTERRVKTAESGGPRGLSNTGNAGWRSLLVARRTILNEMQSIENVVRAILREAGIKLGTPSRADFAERVRELAGGDSAVTPLVEPLLAILATVRSSLRRSSQRLPPSGLSSSAAPASLTSKVDGEARSRSGPFKEPPA